MLLAMVSVDVIFCYKSVIYEANFSYSFTAVIRNAFYVCWNNFHHMLTLLPPYPIQLVICEMLFLY